MNKPETNVYLSPKAQALDVGFKGSAVDLIIIFILLAASTSTFFYGDPKSRLFVLLLALSIGLFKPLILIFAFSLSTSLDITGHFLTPTRLFVIFAGLSVLPRTAVVMKSISNLNSAFGILFCSYIFWNLVCAFIRIDIQAAISIVTVFAFVTVSLFIIESIQDKEKIICYLCLGLIPTVCLCLSVMLDIRTPNPQELVITDDGIRYRGIVNDPNYLASIIVCGFSICLAFLLTRRAFFRYLLAFAGSIFFFIAVWETQSRGGIYTAFIALGLFFFIELLSNVRRPRFSSLLMLPGILVVPLLIFFQSQGRFIAIVKSRGLEISRGVNIQALSDIFSHPILGVGEQAYLARHRYAAHNTFLSIGVESGMIGMLLMLSIIGFAFVELFKYRNRDTFLYLFPLFSLCVILCSFSAQNYKLLWFFIISVTCFCQRVSLNDTSKDLASYSQ
ncbi:MAG: O-antigen ligase family protein [Deltaproteobacteria bacterium]|nr:O-antigen ligase family protein [Deltaproteobacteria bacterium]